MIGKSIVLLIAISIIGGNDFPKQHIIGGESAERSEFPFQVSIQQKGFSNWEHKCGGTIVHKGWVLTAAHCLLETWNPYWVIAGVLRYYDENDPYRQKRRSRRVYPYPAYANQESTKPAKYDIGLIHLLREFDFNAMVRPAALPFNKTDCASIDREVIISGWGLPVWWQSVSSFDLRYYKTYIVPLQQCRDFGIELYGSTIVDETVICTFDPSKMSCDGDSGGPLIQEMKIETNELSIATPKYVIYGVSSYGERPCSVDVHPEVFTNVCNYVEWIKNLININSGITP